MTSFESIYHQYYPSCLHFAMKITGSREAAEDVVMGVFTTFWKYRSRICDESTKAWLMIDTKRKSINCLTAKKYVETRKKEFADTCKTSVPANLSRSVISHIHEEINRLPEQRRKIMKLRIEGYDRKEIARMLGISPFTVRTQVAIATKTLRIKLFEEMEEYY